MVTSEEGEAEAWLIKNGVIPMPIDPYEWTSWNKTFCLFPRKNINSKFIWGIVYKRKRAVSEELLFVFGKRIYNYDYEYANKKDIFKQTLKGENNDD